MRRIALIGDEIIDGLYTAQGGKGIEDHLRDLLPNSTIENFGITGAYIGSDWYTNKENNTLQYMNIKLRWDDPRNQYLERDAFNTNLLSYIQRGGFNDVIIMLGKNDIDRSESFETIGNVLANMIGQFGDKTRVHLFAPPNRKFQHQNHQGFVRMLEAVANLKKDKLNFTGPHVTRMDQGDFVNNVSPNANGLRKIAADMYKTLAPTSGPVPTPMTPGVIPTRPLTQYPDRTDPLHESGADVWLEMTQNPDYPYYAYSWFPSERPPGRKGRLVVHKQSSLGTWEQEDVRDTEMHLWEQQQGQVVVSEANQVQTRRAAKVLTVVKLEYYGQLQRLINALQSRAPVPHVPSPYTVVPGTPVRPATERVIVCIGDSLIDSVFAKSISLTTSVPAELRLLFDESSTKKVKIIDLARGGIHMTNYLQRNCGAYDSSVLRDPEFQSGCVFADTYEQWIQKPKHKVTDYVIKVTDYVIMLGTNDIKGASFNADAFEKAATKLIELCSRGGARIFVFTPPHFLPSAVPNPNIERNRTPVKKILERACNTGKCTFVETRGFEEVDFHDYVHFKDSGMKKLAGYFHDALTGASIPVDPSDPGGPMLPFAPPVFTAPPPAFTSPIVSAQVLLPFTEFDESQRKQKLGTFDMYQVISQSGYFFTYRDTNDKNTSVSLYYLDTTNMTFRQVSIASTYDTPLKGTRAGDIYTIKNIFATAIGGGSQDERQVKMRKMPFDIFKNFKPPSEGPPSEGPPSEGPPSEDPPSQGPPAVVLPEALPFTSPNRDNKTIQIYEVLNTDLKLYFTYTHPGTVVLYQEIRGSLEEIPASWSPRHVQATHLNDKFTVTNFIHPDLGPDIQIRRIDMDSTRLPPAVIQPVPMVPQPVIQPAVPLPMVPQPVMQPVVPPFGRPAQPLPADPSFVVLPKSGEGAIYKIDDTKGFVWVPGEGFSGDYTEVVKDGDHWQKSKSQKRTVHYTYDDFVRDNKYRIRMDDKQIVVEQVYGVQFKEYSEERNLFDKVWDGIKDFFDWEWYFIVGAIVGACIVLAFVYVCFKVCLKAIRENK